MQEQNHPEGSLKIGSMEIPADYRQNESINRQFFFVIRQSTHHNRQFRLFNRQYRSLAAVPAKTFFQGLENPSFCYTKYYALHKKRGVLQINALAQKKQGGLETLLPF